MSFFQFATLDTFRNSESLAPPIRTLQRWYIAKTGGEHVC